MPALEGCENPGLVWLGPDDESVPPITSAGKHITGDMRGKTDKALT